ncbi:MAG: ABC transporter substrate-binding protein [Rhizobiales bacterium]|nr:ABC transporter substrate-binding protein [Hyphomicrobiales bacterium]
MSVSRRLFLALPVAGLIAASMPAFAADQIKELRIDWATYNPVSLALKDQGLLEKEFEKDGISVTWVQSAGSNKALEFLNAGSLDFSSSAGAAALVARINGNPVRSIYVYSKPEWTALVTTRGTDPHIFLVRALADAGLTEKDVTFVLLQHADGETALIRGDVDAWAGLDPMMAAAELQDGARLFFRNADANSWGVLNTTEDFAKDHPDIVKRVLATYEVARKWSLANPDKLKALLAKAAKLPEDVIARQLERNDLTYSSIGDQQKATILAAGLALQKAGVLKADVDVKAAVDALVDTDFPVAAQ